LWFDLRAIIVGDAITHRTHNSCRWPHLQRLGLPRRHPAPQAARVFCNLRVTAF
jgi:hypothetical protein